jgi:DNA polymerase-4
VSPRIILHVDMDAFYAAVEQRDDPTLRGKPVIVGGSAHSRGVVSAASYEARAFGVHSAMPAAQAARLCPQGVFRPVNMRKYHAVSEQVMAILSRHSDTIERMSIDEAYLDLTGRAADFAQAGRTARAIKQQIRGELQLTASVGVGPNKFLAKLCSDLRKPDGLVAVRPEEAKAFLAPLAVGKLWGVGPKTAARLEGLGLRTIGDVANQPIERLRALVGAWGDAVCELSRGIDERPVTSSREVKSISAETTFAHDLHDEAEMRRVLADLSRDVSRRLQSEQVRARTIAVKVRFADFHTLTRQTTLPDPADQAAIIRRTAHQLLAQVDRAGRGVRLLGVRATGLERGGGQLSLFDPAVQRRGQLAETLRYVRDRFGEDAVKWARDLH